MAKSLPLVVTEGTPQNALAVLIAGAVQPSDTIGSTATSLLENKPSLDDAKLLVERPANSLLGRIIMLPSAVADSDALIAGYTALGSIVRDDSTKQVSTHTLTPEAGKAADDYVLALSGTLAAQKPARSMSSLINALSDALDAFNSGAGPSDDIILVVDQLGDGEVRIFKGTAGVNAGATGDVLADISQDNAPATTTAPSLW